MGYSKSIKQIPNYPSVEKAHGTQSNLQKIFNLPTWYDSIILTKTTMRKAFLILVCSVMTLHNASAEALSDADRETLLNNLDKMKETADARANARFGIALAAFRNAIQSEDTVIEFYLNCIEKVNFTDQQKKTVDFREWKRTEADKLSEPGLRLALAYQLKWLILTLQATSENVDRTKLASEAQNIVDAIFSNPSKLVGQENLLNQSVTSSIFARTYDINSIELEKWPMSPINLEQVYNNILLPPYQNPKSINELRTLWIRRIHQECMKAEFWTEPVKQGKKEEKKIGMASAMRPPEYEKFKEETLPELEWEMEVDLFTHGDQSVSSIRMMALLQKNLSHASVNDWAQELRDMLAPSVPQKPTTP